MYYFSIGLIAALVLVIENRELIFSFGRRKLENKSEKAYITFLFSVLFYYITDSLWGVFDVLGLRTALYVDTIIYFIAMGAAVYFWTAYVVTYLDRSSFFAGMLKIAAIVFFIAFMVVLVINFFHPIHFFYDESGNYQTGIVRNILLIVQILMFFVSFVYAIYEATRSSEKMQRRHIAIGLFGLIMAVLLTFQYIDPLLPLYSVGYMLGTCLIHSFVIGDEKEESKRELEESLEREKRQREELKSAWNLAYTDPLTGAKSKLAYVEAEEKMDRDIRSGKGHEFAVAVFDLNDLKHINDTQGHEIGDMLIIDASRKIFDAFKCSDVFRIGGDEFAAIIEGIDFEGRVEALDGFNAIMEENAKKGSGVVVSAGMSDFVPSYDHSIIDAFERADQRMYDRKRALKAMKSA
ncbi:MAG: diguanylate cyclase [Oscillospiraceae bacterium]|nr:diguanylate cyclase [Oscillospiraceae bacterium]